jgi:TFIIF-interacting CTD phosphatase-like protein
LLSIDQNGSKKEILGFGGSQANFPEQKAAPVLEPKPIPRNNKQIKKFSLGGKEEKITASPSSLSPQTTTTTTKNQNQEQTESLPNPINQEQKQKKKKIKNASLPTLAKNASGGGGRRFWEGFSEVST